MLELITAMDSKSPDTKVLEALVRNCRDENELKKLLESKRTLKPEYYIDNLLRRKNLSKADLLKKANIEESYGYQLLRGSRKLPRDRVIQLSIAMGLSVDETSDFLKQAGHQPLYPKARSNRDMVILYCIEKRLSLIETELVLERFGEKQLQNYAE